MLAGPVEIIKCPYCDQKFKQDPIMSGNIIGAKFWTDGYSETPMLPDRMTISFCEVCRKYFWVDEATMIDEFQPDHQKYPDANYLKDLTLEQYIDAFEKIEIRSEQDKFYQLRQIWWKYNDYHRKNKEDELPHYIKNIVPEYLNKLLNNFDESKDRHLLLKGELLRELKQFKAAEKTLEKISSPDYRKIKQFIMNLAKNKDSELKELEM